MSAAILPAGAPRREWFAESIHIFDSVSGVPPFEAIVEAMMLWTGYPLSAEQIECLPGAIDPTDDCFCDERQRLRRDLNYAHHLAAQLLAREAQRVGLNPAPLMEARRVCQEIFGDVRRDPYPPSPHGVRWFHHPRCTSDTWPECLGEWRYSLPPAMQDAIREGEEVRTRLVMILDADRLRVKAKSGSVAAGLSDPAGQWLVSARQLATEIGLPVKRVMVELSRLVVKRPDCRIEQKSRRRGEPRYLYRLGDVLPELCDHFQVKPD